MSHLIRILALFAMPPMFVHAADAVGTPGASNVGFVDTPKAELRERFPMCEAFLSVDWIDPVKRIGYSHYEVIERDENYQYVGKRMLWAVVAVGQGRIDYDVYDYRRKKKLDELFRRIRTGRVTAPDMTFPLVIENGGTKDELFPVGGLSYLQHFRSLGDNLQTVCVAYPDKANALIVEARTPRTAFDSTRYQTLFESWQKATGEEVIHRRQPGGKTEELRVKNSSKDEPLAKSLFDTSWVLDVNFDGVEDLIFHTGN